ncbi:MAG: hypothetical protein ACI8W8_001886 [Rhodothermales bacterium]|jgi:hypothetical protein
MFRRCLILMLLIAAPSQAAVIWLEIGSAGTPAQNADGGPLAQSDIDGLAFAVKDSGGAVISTASAAGLDEAGAGHFIGVIHLGEISETAVTLQLRRLVDKQFASAGSGTALLDDFEPQVDPATYKITASTLTWVFTNANPIASDASFTTDEDIPLTHSVAGNDADGDPLTFALVSGPVPLTADGNFTYLPAANFAGTESFTFTVNDGFADSATGVATLVVAPVNDPPVADSASVTATEDTPLTGTLSGSDIDSSFSFSQVSGNVSIASDGSFTYTPAADFAGNDNFVFRVSDGSLTDTATFSVTVTPVNDPPIATLASFSTDEDAPLLDAVTASDIDSPALQFTHISGSVILATDGNFTYIPPAEFAGSDNFTFQVSDGDASSTAVASISIAPVDDTPIADAASFTTVEDTPLTAAVSASDVDSADLSFSLVSGPIALATDGSFTYTPPADFAGANSFSFRVSDGNSSANGRVDILVTPVNDAPSALRDSFTIAEDSPAQIFDLLANDTDADNDPLTLIGGPFSYAPPANFHGSASFCYIVSDGQATDSATVLISITAANDAPSADSAAFTTVEDTPIIGQLTGADLDGEAYSFSLISGAISLATDGNFTYNPPANFHGSRTFRFKTSDGFADSAIATGSISITPVNDPPVVVPDEFVIPEDSVLIDDILANDSDVDSTITAVLLADVANGSLSLASDGNFSYTPVANFAGSDSFSYQAFDGEYSISASVSITISAINDPPVALAASFSTLEDTPLTGQVAASDSDGPEQRFVLVSGSVSLATDGSFTYEPATDFFGTDSFNFRVSDGIANSAPAQVLIVVDSPPALQLIGEASMRVPPGYVFVDPGARAYDYAEGDLTDSITVEGAVDTGLEAIFDLTYRVSDSLGFESVAIRQIHVTSTVVSHELILSRGWNLISVPGIPDLPVGSMFGPECSGASVFEPEVGPISRDAYLQPGLAYWIFLHRPCVANIVTEHPQPITLALAADVFQHIGPISPIPWPGLTPPTIMWYWHANRYTRQDPSLPMQIGRGYIIYLESAETVVLPTD